MLREILVRVCLLFNLERELKNPAAELTPADIVAIDVAGAAGARQLTVRTFVNRVAAVTLATALAFAVCGYMGVDLI